MDETIEKSRSLTTMGFGMLQQAFLSELPEPDRLVRCVGIETANESRRLFAIDYGENEIGPSTREWLKTFCWRKK